MSTTPRRLLNPMVGYTLVLVALALLGLFTAALAYRSGLAAGLGIGLVMSMAAAVVCFRAGAADLESIRAQLDSGPVSIWAERLSAGEIRRYHVRHRGADALGPAAQAPAAQRDRVLTAA